MNILERGWTSKPLKQFARTFSGAGFPIDAQGLQDEAIPFHKVASLSLGNAEGYISGSQDTVSKETAARLRAPLLRSGSIVIAKIGAALLLGRVRQLSEVATIDNNMLGIVPVGASDRFVYYVLQTVHFDALVNPGAVPSLSDRNLRAWKFAVPPLDEQRQIAEYLDRETGKIDELIAKQEQLVAVLIERRIALVNLSVTEGIVPEVQRKTESVLGLLNIPASWMEISLTRAAPSRVDYRGATPTKTESGVQLVTARNVKSGWIDYETSQEFIAAEDFDAVMRRGLPRIGDILMTMEAPLGNVAVVDREDVAFAQRVIKFRLNPALADSEFVSFSMNSDYFQQQLMSKGTGSTAIGLKASKLVELYLALPPISEQKRIASHLKSQTQQMDLLMKTSRQLALQLRERRAALISAAVTGKIDARGL